MQRDEDMVMCTDGRVCHGEGFGYRSQGAGDDFVCLSCQQPSYEVGLMRFLLKKLDDVRKAPGDSYRFTVRELVQNADDAHAGIVALRVDEDALYVANDGFAFRPRNEKIGFNGDYVRICSVLARPKADDSETTGNYGSGFQTVYYFTNNPEVFSAGIAARMNPAGVDKRIESLQPSKEPRNHSPYAKTGVLFRFPWRKPRSGKRLSKRDDPFADIDWPTWSPKEIEKLTENLRDYLHDLILCCQNINVIRMIWDNGKRAYQVERSGFRMNEIADSVHEANVKEGFVKIPKDWDKGFQLDAVTWNEMQCPEEGWRYLIGSDYVRDSKGQRVFFGEDNDGKAIITSKIDAIVFDEMEPDKRRIKLKNQVHVLLPMFETESRNKQRPIYFKYSVLPIPTPGRNRFACTAHLTVEEDRSSLRMGDFDNKEWLKMVMSTLKNLFLKTLQQYITRVEKEGIEDDLKQRLIMNNLPMDSVSEWIDPKGGHGIQLEELTESLNQEIIRIPILMSGKRFISPQNAYWINDKELRGIVHRMGFDVLSDDFINHPNFTSIEKSLKHRVIWPEDFIGIWGRFFEMNSLISMDGDDSCGLKKGLRYLQYNQELGDGTKLDESFIKDLITYCFNSDNIRLQEMRIIPDAHGILKEKKDFPIIPNDYQELLDILPLRHLIHPSFREHVMKILHDEISAIEILTAMSEAIAKQPNRFNMMSEKDHSRISKVLARAVERKDFHTDVFDTLEFIPYEQNNQIKFGRPNSLKDGKVVSVRFRPEQALPEHIFKIQRKDIPGMTDELRIGIRFLKLKDLMEDKIEIIEDKLNLVALMESNIPTNLIRLFVSPKHLNLFEDSNLLNFLRTESRIPTERFTNDFIDGQKRELLKAVKAYFMREGSGTETGVTRDDMKIVPCLYDTKERWFPAGEFAIDLDEALTMLGKRALHSDFSSWDRKSLVNRLGVCESPEQKDILDTLTRLASGKKKDREAITSILKYLLISDIENVRIDKVTIGKIPELIETPWIPTRGGGYRGPRDCVIPLQENLEILGCESPCLVDLPEEIFSSASVIERATRIGMNRNPDIESLQEVVISSMDKGVPPPDRIFDALSSERILKEVEDNPTSIRYGELGYFKDGNWRTTEEIRILEGDGLPEYLKKKFLIISHNHSHSRYLRTFMEVDIEIYDYEVLTDMVDDRSIIDRQVWTYLSTRKHKGIQRLKAFGNKAIYPNPDSEDDLIRSDRMILQDDELFSETGTWGEWHVLHRDIDENLKSKLLAIGMRTIDELTAKEIKAILTSMGWKGERRRDDSLHRKMMSLVLNLAKRYSNGEEVTLQEQCIPFIKGESMVCNRIRDCYLDDTYLSHLFREKLPILDNVHDNRYYEVLRDFYYENEAISLDESIKRRPERRPESVEEPDFVETMRFRELYKALVKEFEMHNIPKRSLEKLVDDFVWLKEATAYRYEDITISNEIDGITVHQFGYHIEEVNGRYHINIARVAPRAAIEEIAEEIAHVNTSLEVWNRRFEIVRILQHLLDTTPRRWEVFIPGYRFTENIIIPPLIEIELDLTAEGYMETRNTLKGWYNACQICMSRTPATEDGIESCETVTSTVTLRGGRYHGKVDSYSPEGCLFLCPTHQALFHRGLIRIPYLEGAIRGDYRGALRITRERLQDLTEKVSKKKYRKNEIIPDDVGWEAFETPTENFKINEERWDWIEIDIHFRVEHLISFLGWNMEYLRRRMNE